MASGMMDMTEQKKPRRPRGSSPHGDIATSKAVATELIATQLEARNNKTARLRALRLGQPTKIDELHRKGDPTEE